MASSFYKVNSQDSIGGPARVLVAASTYPAVSRLSEICDLSTYVPAATYGYVDLGSTTGETRFQIGFARNQWANEQSGPYRLVPTDWSGQINGSFLEITQDNKEIGLLGRAATDTGGSEHRTDFGARASIPYVHVCVMMLDQDGRIHASIFPKCQWDGSQVQEAIARGNPRTLPLVWAAFPDDTLTNSVGEAILRYDIDQYRPGA